MLFCAMIYASWVNRLSSKWYKKSGESVLHAWLIYILIGQKPQHLWSFEPGNSRTRLLFCVGSLNWESHSFPPSSIKKSPCALYAKSLQPFITVDFTMSEAECTLTTNQKRRTVVCTSITCLDDCISELEDKHKSSPADCLSTQRHLAKLNELDV